MMKSFMFGELKFFGKDTIGESKNLKMRDDLNYNNP